MNFILLKAYECPVCLDILKDPKILVNCGHSICEQCSKAISGFGSITCPQCRTASSYTKTNFAVKSALEFLERGDRLLKGSEEIIGKQCKHSDFEDEEKMELCDHCNSHFCSNCLLGHKVFIRIEAGITASIVSWQVATSCF